ALLASDISGFFSQASGTSIIMTSGNERPVIINNSTTMSIEAESDLPGNTIGRMFFISFPNHLLSISSWRENILATLPLKVFISPLWHMYLNGCAKSHVGNVFVENRW